MSPRVLSRALTSPALPRLAVGVTIAVSAALAGIPAFADDHQATDQSSISRANAAPARQSARLTADALIRVAESQIGVTENAVGGGTPFHNWYMTSPRAAETVARDGGNIRAYANAPWCAMFVSWVGEKAGLRSTVGWDAYTITWAKWFKANKRWGTVAKPGAVVYFSWDSKTIDSIDHMGLVKKDNGDGTITTIEGNTGNGKVEQRVRPTSQVVGYGYPQYKA
ncbi:MULTISPECIES: CHAP domain-containing protein [unclassified Nonomuraea]|uniref:CHAP domain-containing protein n=1 Tax=unclassified Nonomuraea TaxID=2593643 RepID=UPI0033D4D771